MDKLIAAIEENTAVMRELLKLETARQQQTDWMQSDAAAQLLGLNLTASNHHRRRLNAAAKRHGIRMRNTRPPSYWREDIYELHRKILEGKAMI